MDKERTFSANGFDFVKIEEAVPFIMGGNIILDKSRPDSEILPPIAKLHVKGAINRLKPHLVVKTVTIGHGTFPAWARRFNHHF